MAPSISINKPRINNDDNTKLDTLFEVMIQTPRMPLDLLIWNTKTIWQNKAIIITCNNHQNCLNRTLDEMLDYIWTHKLDDQCTTKEQQAAKFLKYMLTDYHANCNKPPYAITANERTPFNEYVIPTFKYFSSATGLLSFIW
jgi:uncharacterized protein YxeA